MYSRTVNPSRSVQTDGCNPNTGDRMRMARSRGWQSATGRFHRGGRSVAARQGADARCFFASTPNGHCFRASSEGLVAVAPPNAARSFHHRGAELRRHHVAVHANRAVQRASRCVPKRHVAFPIRYAIASPRTLNTSWSEKATTAYEEHGAIYRLIGKYFLGDHGLVTIVDEGYHSVQRRRVNPAL